MPVSPLGGERCCESCRAGIGLRKRLNRNSTKTHTQIRVDETVYFGLRGKTHWEMSTSRPISRPENQPLSFPVWKAALPQAAIPAGQRGAFQRGILAFLHHCPIRRAPATILKAKEYLAASRRQGPNGPREALR